jgi:hypothetical protein
LYGTAALAAGYSPSGVERGGFPGLGDYLPRSLFPLRRLHPQVEVTFAQLTDARGPAFADLKLIQGRIEDVSGNGHLGAFIETSYGGSRRDVLVSQAPLSSSPLDVSTLAGGAFLELPIHARLGFYGEMGYIFNRLNVSVPNGGSLVPGRDNHAQGRYGVRLFVSEGDALSCGRITGHGAYLAPLDTEFSWRHTLGDTSSLSLRYRTGPAVKSWEAGFALGF